MSGGAAADAARPRWPPSFFVLISTEFAERFSYYGLKAILALYLVDELGASRDGAMAAFSALAMAAYAAAVAGGWLSDVHWGRYTTIVRGALLYTVGAALLAFTAAPPVLAALDRTPFGAGAGAAIALAAIAAGTGATKPCVSAFMADQFAASAGDGGAATINDSSGGPAKPAHPLLSQAFDWFYFVLNAGALLSTTAVPLLRTHYRSYALAFALPAAVMLSAFLLFFAGRRAYVVVPPSGPANDALARSARVVRAAVGFRWRRWRRRTTVADALCFGGDGAADWAQRVSFLDGARVDPAVAADDVRDVRQTARVLRLLALLPLFWALFDQHATRWVFQAVECDRRVEFGVGARRIDFTLQPDQMPTLNPVFTLLVIALFSRGVYPLMRRVRRRRVRARFGADADMARADELPLVAWRLVPGMLFTALAFVFAGALQAAIERRAPPEPSADGSDGGVSVLWQVPQYVALSVGEVMVSVTCLELAYREAPERMKSVVAAGWMLTTSVGNLFNLVTARLHFGRSMATDFYVFAGLMAANAVLFAWLNRGGFPRIGAAPPPPPAAARDPLSDSSSSGGDGGGDAMGEDNAFGMPILSAGSKHHRTA